MTHAYLTADLPGTGGLFKECPEDFMVAEIPSYLPCGEGEHVYVEIEKRGITTLEALRRTAKSLGISDREIGYAGMKDAVGVTRQTFSIPRVAPEALLVLEIPGLRVLSAVRHKNKLRLGHLQGNRFHIRVREVCSDACERAAAVLALLARRGMPNFFGMQRYGVQGNSHLVGGYLLRGDMRKAVETIIGDPEKVRDERWRAAIEAYHQGDVELSLKRFPHHCRTERDILTSLVKYPDAWDKALKTVHPRMKKLYLSAYQSSLFDRLLEGRLATLDQLVAGDLAFKHANGACFLVEDPALEAPRAAALEISPTGPMFGSKMMHPGGEVLALEEAALQDEGLTWESFSGGSLEGERRPFRVPVGEARVEMDGEGLLLEFVLPRGSYATAVLREVMKSDPAGIDGI